jgi:hypothetical protein
LKSFCLASYLALASVTAGVARVHPSSAPASPPLAQIRKLLPADGTRADVMQLVAPPRLNLLTAKLQQAAQKQPEWWIDQLHKAKPGEPLPYDPRLGLTKEEYKELLSLWGAFSLRKTRTVRLSVKRDGMRITFNGGEELPDLRAVVVDLETGAVTTPYGTATQWSRVEASPEQKATGPWNGVAWELERVDERTGLGTVVTFDLGRLRQSGLSIYASVRPNTRADVPELPQDLRGAAEPIPASPKPAECLANQRVRGVTAVEEPEQDVGVKKKEHQRPS